ncbi:MAG: ATP-binding cassette domain-containing protein [Bacteroidia bacterium]
MPLQVHSLTKRYGNQIAVDSLSFSLHAGEIVGFLGPNGAGKSTTFRMLTGYLQPDAGEITFHSWKMGRDTQLIQKHIGYLPEHNPLYGDLYVREFLTFAGGLYGMKGKTLRQRVDQVIEAVGLTPEAHKRVAQLSKGYRQRVGIAQAILHKPALLILDEPTSGLDPNQVQEIRALIRTLGKESAILFSSHILSEVQAIAHRILILHKGKLVLDTPLDKLESSLKTKRYRVELSAPNLPWELPQEVHIQTLSPTLFLLEAPPSIPLPNLIYQQSLKHHNPLLRLEEIPTSLEEVFQALTA